MGLDKTTLPDSFLKKISPADRKAAGLPAPLSEIVAKSCAKSEAKREKELQNQIENWLRLRGITAIRSRMDRATSNNRGTPDFLFAVSGRAVALEVKVHGNLTPEQLKMIIALRKDGWRVQVIYSLEEARAVVLEVEKSEGENK